MNGVFVEEMGGLAAPSAYNVFRGLEINGTLASFQNSDDVRATYNPGFTINNSEAPVWLVFEGNANNAFEFLVESQSGTPGLAYTVEAYDWNTGQYDVIGIFDESFNSDQIETFTIDPTHVDAGGDVESRIGWRQTGFTINFPWEVRVDQVGWSF